MIPELEREMKEKLAATPVDELVPGFDADAEWAGMSARLHPARPRMISLRVWFSAAAVLLLMAGGVWMLQQRDVQRMAAQEQHTAREEWAASFKAEVDKEQALVDSQKGASVAALPDKVADTPKERKVAGQRTTKELVRNGTPCPLEISINQIMKCPNKKPAAISSCNTLEPGQAASLGYKDSDAIASNCSLTVKTIEIKSIATGETILLDENSSITAAEVFSYMSGEKQGDIYAGIFNSDCNNNECRHNLRLGSREGDIIIH